MRKKYDVIIIGAGPSGIGTAIALKEMGVKNVVILERYSVGESFKRWPKETSFITPSFASNSFLMPDLNAITPLSSPALQFKKERINGTEYADYLHSLVEHYKLAIHKGVDVASVAKEASFFLVHTNIGTYNGKYVVWAAGEFQYPHTDLFLGSELCVHTSTIDSYQNITGKDVVIIGGYESGADAAINLSRLGKKSLVLDAKDRLGEDNDDPSIALSPYTQERLREEMKKELIQIRTNITVVKVSQDSKNYIVTLQSGESLQTKSKPLLATGFKTSTVVIENLFERTDNGDVLLTDKDELTQTSNIFLVGPMVHHADIIFCFIYKNRMRFAVVAAEIASRLGFDPSDTIAEYKKYNMYLEDCNDCAGSCNC